MNERIKELWEKAAETTQGDSWEEQTKFMEKFAELIVAECGVALSPMLRDMVSRGQAFDLIKQHFGVEE
jgi:peptide subunit release factor 1 (eRF1)